MFNQRRSLSSADHGGTLILLLKLFSNNPLIFRSRSSSYNVVIDVESKPVRRDHADYTPHLIHCNHGMFQFKPSCVVEVELVTGVSSQLNDYLPAFSPLEAKAINMCSMANDRASVKRKPFRVMMWSTPRSISTAITKCFSFVDRNAVVFFEPFCLRHIHEWKARVNGWYPENDYADEFDVHHFLSTNYAKLKDSPLGFQFNPDHVDKTLITPESIGKQLVAVPRDRPVFVKDVPLGITGHYHHLPNGVSGYKYAFLIRNPERVMPSLREMLFRQVFMTFGNDVTLEDFDFISDTPYMEEGVFYKSQYDLWKYVKENFDPNPVVIDSEDVLANPADMLSKFCNALGMPWDDSLVSWDPSPSIATSWRVIYPLVTQGTRNEIEDCAHANTLASSGFKPSKPKIPLDELTPDVLRAIEATKGYYAEMAATRIRPSLC